MHEHLHYYKSYYKHVKIAMAVHMNLIHKFDFIRKGQSDPAGPKYSVGNNHNQNLITIDENKL
jgi:hypothetical protein